MNSQILESFHYLEGHGDLVSRLIIGKAGNILKLIRVTKVLTKSP